MLGVLPVHAALASTNIPLVIQEAVYPGSIAGVTRSSDPVTVGVPLPDDPVTGATNVSELALAGATVGQFRVLGRWPSGRIKWVLVDTQASFNAGGTQTSLAVTKGGGGNFGGPNMASDTGATITVATGTATFTIRKANFNGLDQVVVGGTTVIASGRSQGLVMMGPEPGQTTCGPCTTAYSSAHDATSTAVIEENGPARAVVLATGSHKDASGNSYMRFTVRLHFYRGRNVVKITSTLRNADHGLSNTFATAYKGHRGYELRLSPSLSGPASYAIGTHGGSPSTGSLGATDSVYLYQADSQSLRWQDFCGAGCVPYTKDTGYRIVRNGNTEASGTHEQYPQGWADIRDGSGAGLSIGVYQLAAYWPKSLELNEGGSDVRIGIWPRQSSQPYYQAWPQWSTHDLYVNVHGSALPSPGNEFLKFQHYLLGRAPVAHYNASGVFPFPLAEPAVEDAFYESVRSSAVPALSPGRGCCVQDLGTSNRALWPLNVFRWYAWPAGGGSNQVELRWSQLLNFLTRGMAGRYLNAAHFYRHQTDDVFPHSDGFGWRDRAGETDGFGRPNAKSHNAGLAHRNWFDQEHSHWYGMMDYYFLSGDETVRDALLDGPKDWFINPKTYQGTGQLFNTRSVAIFLMGAARYGQFLAAIGDPDAAAVLAAGTRTYEVQVKPELCVSGYPEGCSFGAVNDPATWKGQGVSRTRGVHWGTYGHTTVCGSSYYRVNSAFQAGIMIQALLEFRQARGPSWSDFWTALDLAYGIAGWNLTEATVDNGNGRWDQNGFRYGLALDVPNNCNQNYAPMANQTTSLTFLARHLVDGTTEWDTKFRISVQKLMAALGVVNADHSGFQHGAVISILNSPQASRLQRVPLTAFQDNGGGSYTIGWTVPADARSYRIKWGRKTIVEWIGFDAGTNTFTGDPARTMPWFAAADAAKVPAPAAAGSTQSFTVATGVPGLTADHFTVKAYVGGQASPPPASAPPEPPPAPQNLRILGGQAAPSPPAPAPPVPAPPAPGPSGTVSIEWIRQPETPGWPGYNGYLNLYFDPIAQQTLLYGIVSNSTSIYSSDVFAYRTQTNTWTHLGGNGTRASACPASTATWPGDRHPESMMAIDTRRNVWWMWSGVCFGHNRQDLWYMTLHADPTTNRWTRVEPATLPRTSNSSAMVYDSDNDVLFLFGSDGSAQTQNHWVYCPTWGTAAPGTLTSPQKAAGCSRADDWTMVSVAGGVRPPGVAYPGLVYDAVTRRVIQYGGQTGGAIVQNQTWAYDVPARKWTQKALHTTAPPVYNGTSTPTPGMAYDPATGRIYYRQTHNTGAPQDWVYDPQADTWAIVPATGTGPTAHTYMTFDAATRRLVTFSRNLKTGAPEVWHGVMK